MQYPIQNRKPRIQFLNCNCHPYGISQFPNIHDKISNLNLTKRNNKPTKHQIKISNVQIQNSKTQNATIQKTQNHRSKALDQSKFPMFKFKTRNKKATIQKIQNHNSKPSNDNIP